MNSERWERLLASLGAEPDSATLSKLQAAYSEKHRAYHTARHIGDCLSLFEEVKQLARHPAEVELALWFHDAIYEPMSSSNEERSADWAVEFAKSIGVSPNSAARIREHILATRHVAEPTDGDAHLVVDIDLAILGTPESRYDEFERDVRKEYRWVPGMIYRAKRAEILQSFLGRPRIYHWEAVHQRFEQAARANLSRAIQTLNGGR